MERTISFGLLDVVVLREDIFWNVKVRPGKIWTRPSEEIILLLILVGVLILGFLYQTKSPIPTITFQPF